MAGGPAGPCRVGLLNTIAASPRPLGRSSVSLAAYGFGLGRGGAPIEGWQARIADLATTAYQRGIRYFDVAPLYAAGASELGLGDALSVVGSGHDVVVSTKVSRYVASAPEGPTWWYDFSYDATMRQLDSSLARLRRDRVDIVLIHDPNDHLGEALDGAYRALDDLRRQGVVSAIGVGAFDPDFLTAFVERADLDAVLAADGCSMVDARVYGRLAEACTRRATGILAAGVLRRGLLTEVPSPAARDGASSEEQRRLAVLSEIARAFGLPMSAIALQYPLRHEAVSCVVLAASTADQLATTLDARNVDVPEACWRQIDQAMS